MFHGVSRGVADLHRDQLVAHRPLLERSLVGVADPEVVADNAVAKGDIPVGFQLMRGFLARLHERVREA